MKKVLVATFLFLQVFASMPSYAALILNPGERLNVFGDSPGAAVCLIMLPICIMDSSNSPLSVNKKTLVQNGYTEREAAALMSEFFKLSSILSEHNEKLYITEQTTVDSLRNSIQSLGGFSEDFIQAIAEMNGVTR